MKNETFTSLTTQSTMPSTSESTRPMTKQEITEKLSINNMEEDTYIEYKDYYIYLNYWGEYCILDAHKSMLAWNSSEKTLDGAKRYVDNLIK